MGKLHAGRIDSSPRHERVLRAFRAADHPLSAGEITKAVVRYMVDEGIPLDAALDQSPQAISTTIGEMRSDENRADGYVVSMATYWRVARPGQQTGKRVNKDGSVSFFLPAATEPWHDERPRYYLIAAPGWTPSWRIDEAGRLVRGEVAIATKSTEDTESTEKTGERSCKNRKCGRKLDDDNPDAFCRGTDCRKTYWESILGQKEEEQIQLEIKN